MRLLIPVVLVSFVFLLLSCDQNRVYDEYKEIPDNSWNKNNPITFEFTIRDTLTPHNIYINIRHGGQYQFSNLFLFVNTILPDGKMARDTVELILADPDGRWRGEGLGDIWNQTFPFNTNFTFPQPGDYKISLEQAMRVDELTAVMDVGLRVEEAKD